MSIVVYLLYPTSNHNYPHSDTVHYSVVYLLYPTSNHNSWYSILAPCELYIFYILHQTTTMAAQGFGSICCISFISYIKPQPVGLWPWSWISCISFISYIKPQLPQIDWSNVFGCISFISYIKPQPSYCASASSLVVYLLYPTSNHN